MVKDGAASGRNGKRDTLHVGTEWIEVEILTDPFVVLTRRGYAPAVEVEALSEGKLYTFFVGAASLAEKLEPVRAARGSLEGTQVRLRKQSTERFAQYEVEEVGVPLAGTSEGGRPK